MQEAPSGRRGAARFWLLKTKQQSLCSTEKLTIYNYENNVVLPVRYNTAICNWPFCKCKQFPDDKKWIQSSWGSMCCVHRAATDHHNIPASQRQCHATPTFGYRSPPSPSRLLMIVVFSGALVNFKCMLMRLGRYVWPFWPRCAACHRLPFWKIGTLAACRLFCCCCSALFLFFFSCI